MPDLTLVCTSCFTRFPSGIAMGDGSTLQRLAEEGIEVPPAFLDGAPVAKVGRNEMCPCGAGVEYERCHGQ